MHCSYNNNRFIHTYNIYYAYLVEKYFNNVEIILQTTNI